LPPAEAARFNVSSADTAGAIIAAAEQGAGLLRELVPGLIGPSWRWPL